MTFFYDLNKKLDGIRATPEVKTQQLNEQASPLTQILNERATKEGMGFLGEKGVEEAYNPNSVGAENRRGLDASHAANLKKKAAAGDAKAQAALQHLKDKKERQSNDFNARMERESAGMDESALQAAFGKKKYGDQGMKALQKAGRDNASDSTMNKIRNRYDKYDESMTDEGNAFSGAVVKAKRDGIQPGEKVRVGNKQYPLKQEGITDVIKKVGKVAGAVGGAIAPGIKAVGGAIAPGIKKAIGTGMALNAVDALESSEGGVSQTPKQKAFAKLAPPVNKITFADKIVGAKKAVDEMLGQVAADAMKKAVRGRDRDMEEASTGNAFDYKNFKQPEKQKPTSFVHKGTYGTEYDGDKEDAKAIATKKRAAADAGQGSRGRGRPKKGASVDTGEVMKPDFSAFGDKVKLKPHAGKITKHKMVGEDDLDPKDQGEYDQEGDMAKDSIKTVVRHAQALEKILGDDDNLPEWVQSKLAKIESMMTAVDDYMQNQQDDDMDVEMDEESTHTRDSRAERAGRKVAKDIEYDEKKKDGIHGKRRSSEDNKAERAGKKVTKDIEYDEKKDKKKKEVDETTSSGSVSTGGSAAPKSSGGMSYGKGIYDSLNRELEGMISESMNINMSMNNDSHGGPSRSLTVTATDEDATALANILRMAGMGGGNDHMPHMNNGVVQPDDVKIIDFDDGTDDLAAELSNELHSDYDSNDSETCSTCGSSDCGCDNSDTMDEAYGDTDETLNKPDWPTDAEGSDDAMMYSGGLDGPKSTGQTTIPVIASQQDRQHAYEDAAALRRMMEMAGLPVAEAAAPGSNTVQDPAQQAQASIAASSGMKPSIGGAARGAFMKPSIGGASLKGQTAVKPATKLATPQDVPEPVKPVREDQMAHSLMRELHNFKY